MSYRIRDFILASLGIIVLSPVALAIIVLLHLTQRRVFFVQERPGLHGVPFRLIKFSTLCDAPPGQDEALNQRERLTPVGRYLRAASLDELPQLLNVWKGDMSLVGPRPLLMEYLPLYTPEEHRRHLVRPGITGWAQVHGRNAIRFKDRFRYDCWYVDHRSHLLDLRIVGMTFRQVFRREGVYTDAKTTSPRYDGTN